MDLTLNFLPPGGLSSSVITCVWIGVMVVTFFNLRFGTTLSGLVVPGYLIPLFIVHPVSGYVIIVESIATYFIARFVADRGLVRLGLAEMFGRDRFFMLILISVLVRILSDGFLLPLLAEQLTEMGAPYEVRSGLHSFGLIIIALCANQFWNGGFKVGSLTLALYLFVTYAIVVYVLMPFTNFNISTLGYMYEDIATSILASPKAYIVLITAAYISSRMNLRYGWDFNGILIPSLLALQWYDPLKILATFVEAGVILLLAQGVLKLPLMRSINFEGSRQLLLFFNVGFCYKLVLGFAIIYWIPEQKVTDFYGFGYVLGTLMALKMYQQGIAIRFTRTTLQTSLVAIVFASILGFGLTLFDRAEFKLDDHNIKAASFKVRSDPLDTFIAQVRTESYQSEDAQRQTLPLATELVSFSDMFNQLKSVQLPNTDKMAVINALAQRVGYLVSVVEDRYIVLHDATPQRGWGTYVVDTLAQTDLAVQVPRAMDEPKAAAVALPLMLSLNARYLALAGARATRAKDGSDDVLLNAQSPFQLFHQALANNNALQLRSYTRSAARQLLGLRRDSQALDLDISTSAIFVKRALPPALNLTRLEQLLGGFSVNWFSPKSENRQRDTAIRGFAEVYLNDDSLLNIFSQSMQNQDYQSLAQEQRIDGYLQHYLIEGKLDFAAKHSNSYQVANKYELLYFDQAVLQNTLSLVDAVEDGQWLDKHNTQLKQIANAAKRFGYEVLLYRHITTGARYIIFQPITDALEQRHWGTYVIKVGKASSYFVQVPRPIYEQNTYEFGAVLFEALDARAMLISGTHPWANSDGSAQLTSTQNPDSLFNLFHQSLLAHYAQEAAFAVQVRGYTPLTSEAQDKTFVAHFEYQKPSAKAHPKLLQLKQTLQTNGLTLHQAQEQQIDQRFQARLNAQSRYTRFIAQAQYAEVWLPTLLRQQFKRTQQDGQLAKKVAASGVELIQTDVKTYLARQQFSVAEADKVGELKSLLLRFEQSQNINLLMQLKHAAQEVSVVVDNNTKQHFMTFSDSQGRLLLVANLLPLNANQSNHDIVGFFDNRQHFLEFREMP